MVDKKVLLEEVVTKLQKMYSESEQAVKSQDAETAECSDAMESRYDTCREESAYLAEGLAQRTIALRKELFAFLTLRTTPLLSEAL